MNAAFFAIVGARFFSSLADSALFILCVSLVATLSFPQWMTPMLKMGFVLSYIVLAPFAGAFADSFPKGRVMLLTNTVRMLGCSLITVGVEAQNDNVFNGPYRKRRAGPVAALDSGTAMSLYRPDFDSELTYVGAEGTTGAGPPSRRIGIEFSNYCKPYTSTSTRSKRARSG